MEHMEYLRRVNIGLYLPTDSYLHRLDARVKLLTFLLGVGGATVVSSLKCQGAFLLLVVILFVVARMPLRFVWGGLKPALPFLLAFGVLDIVFAPTPPRGMICNVLLVWNGWTLTSCILRTVALLFLRFAGLMLWTSLLTATTTTVELGRGLGWFLSPLNRIGLPGYEVALIFALTFRFVPSFALEAERLVKAQMARGMDFGEGSRWRFWRRTRAMMPLLIPFFLMALRRAEEAAVAMEARGFISGADWSNVEESMHKERRCPT